MVAVVLEEVQAEEFTTARFIIRGMNARTRPARDDVPPLFLFPPGHNWWAMTGHSLSSVSPL